MSAFLQAIDRGRTLADAEITAILDEFQARQPVVYDGIYGPWSDGIAEINLDMAKLYLDLCFDVIFAYRESRGAIPVATPEESTRLLVSLEQELLAIGNASAAHERFRSRLKDRVVARFASPWDVLALIEHLGAEVERYTAHRPGRSNAVHTVLNLLFLLISALEESYATLSNRGHAQRARPAQPGS